MGWLFRILHLAVGIPCLHWSNLATGGDQEKETAGLDSLAKDNHRSTRGFRQWDGSQSKDGKKHDRLCENE